MNPSPHITLVKVPDCSAWVSKMVIGSWVALAQRFSSLRPLSCSGSAGEWPWNLYVWTCTYVNIN